MPKLSLEQLRFAAYDLNTALQLDEDSFIDVALPEKELKKKIEKEAELVTVMDTLSKRTWRVLKLLNKSPHESVAKSPSYSDKMEEKVNKNYKSFMANKGKKEKKPELIPEETIQVEPEKATADVDSSKAEKALNRGSKKKATVKKVTGKKSVERKETLSPKKEEPTEETTRKKRNVGAKTKPGVIKAIEDCLVKKYMTLSEVTIELLKQFPDRNHIGLAKTVSAQVVTLFPSKGYTMEEKDGKNGKMYKIIHKPRAN